MRYNVSVLLSRKEWNCLYFWSLESLVEVVSALILVIGAIGLRHQV